MLVHFIFMFLGYSAETVVLIQHGKTTLLILMTQVEILVLVVVLNMLLKFSMFMFLSTPVILQIHFFYINSMVDRSILIAKA